MRWVAPLLLVVMTGIIVGWLYGVSFTWTVLGVQVFGPVKVIGFWIAGAFYTLDQHPGLRRVIIGAPASFRWRSPRL